MRLEPVLEHRRDEADVTSLGRPFQTFAPATGKVYDLRLLTDGDNTLCLGCSADIYTYCSVCSVCILLFFSKATFVF